MGIIGRLKQILADPDIHDAELYEHVARELANGYRRPAFWAKALAEADFNEQRATAIYMRMVVKVLPTEWKAQAEQRAILEHQQAQEQLRMEQSAMEGAYGLYNAGRYDEALEGLQLRIERLHDEVAMACVANIFWHGLSRDGVDYDVAVELIQEAEKSSLPSTRKFIGHVLEQISPLRALDNFDFAARAGDRDAKRVAKRLRLQLKQQGTLRRTLWDKITG